MGVHNRYLKSETWQTSWDSDRLLKLCGNLAPCCDAPDDLPGNIHQNDGLYNKVLQRSGKENFDSVVHTEIVWLALQSSSSVQQMCACIQSKTGDHGSAAPGSSVVLLGVGKSRGFIRMLSITGLFVSLRFSILGVWGVWHPWRQSLNRSRLLALTLA